MSASKNTAKQAELRFYQLRVGTSLYQSAVRYFQDTNTYCADIDRIVKKYNADSASMGDGGSIRGLYFPDKAPSGWKLKDHWLYHSPKEKLLAHKVLSAPRRPWSNSYVGTLSKPWDDIPHNERPYANFHLAKLGQNFILVAKFHAVPDQAKLNLYRSPLDEQKPLDTAALAALYDAVPAEDRLVFDHDVEQVEKDMGSHGYFRAGHIELSRAFNQSTAMQDITQQRRARQEKWEANPIKRAGDKVISCALFPVVALIIMSGAADPFFRGGRGSGGPR